MKKTNLKKNLFKKGISGFLALCMAVSMVPTHSFAKGNDLSASSITYDKKDTFLAGNITINEPHLFYVTPDETTIKSLDPKHLKFEKEYNEETGCYQFTVTATKIGDFRFKVTSPTDVSYGTFHVKRPIEPTKQKISMKAGTTYDTSLIIFTDYYANKISVTSSDKKVATASIVGNCPAGKVLRIKAKKTGTAIITINNDTKKNPATIKVNVKNKYTTVPTEETSGTRRALIIGEQYKGDLEIPLVFEDADQMASLCESTGYSSVNTIKNAKKSKIQKAIQNTFKDATKNDVSLFYFEGWGTEHGELVTYENQSLCDAITPTELAKWLSAIPGKVIVVLDYDASGTVINKGLNTSTNLSDSATDTVAQASQNIINAFAAQDQILAKKSGVLCKNKFKVLTACRKDQLTWHVSGTNIFPYTIFEGVGIDEFGNLSKKTPADYNKDKKVTLDELHEYLEQYCFPEFQRIQCYPEKSGFVFFDKTK